MIISKKNVEEQIQKAEQVLAATWQKFDEIKNHNQIKVLESFKKAQVQSSHFAWTSGYGYDDIGKEKIDEVFADYFGTESALVRPQLVSGTHAISAAILGNLNAGEELVCVCGKPYDTLQTVFRQYVKKYGIVYREGLQYLSKNTKVAFIQRSRGYEWRDSLKLDELQNLIVSIRSISPQAIVFVDNCYGEFTQVCEPGNLSQYYSESGQHQLQFNLKANCNADLIAGSLIKNPGGGIVNAGAYIAGKRKYVESAAETLTAPGIGAHGGCMFDQTRLYFQGFFMAPLIVCEALKGMSLAAKIFADLGFETIPKYDAERNDVIQAIKFNNAEQLIRFCGLVQEYSPINSMFTPIPANISGYDDQVIMAAGTFIEGSSIELSADGPLREPYIVYFQGGLSYAHTRYVISKIVTELTTRLYGQKF